METLKNGDKIVRLYGKNVNLCVPRLDDAEVMLFCRWVNDPAIATLIGRAGKLTQLKELKEYLLFAGRIIFTISVTESPDSIGLATIDFRTQQRTASLGIVIGEPQFWHKGYGTETTQMLINFCKNELNAHRIVWSSYSDNPYAIKCAQATGFSICLTEHESEYHGGRYHDRITLEMICD